MGYVQYMIFTCVEFVNFAIVSLSVLPMTAIGTDIRSPIA